MFSCGQALAKPESLTSNKIKAVLIYNFINFTQWPDSAYQSETSPYNICIASKDKPPKVFHALDRRTIRGRKLQTSQLLPSATLEKIEQCQLIFIRLESKKAQDKLLEKVLNLPILTISDENNSKEMGAMINFVNDDDNIAFVINRSKANLSTIQFSSKMLRLALKVIEKKDEAGGVEQKLSSSSKVASSIKKQLEAIDSRNSGGNNELHR